MDYYRNYDTPMTHNDAKTFPGLKDVYRNFFTNVHDDLASLPQPISRAPDKAPEGIYVFGIGCDSYAWDKLGRPTMQAPPDAVDLLSSVEAKHLSTSAHPPKGVVNINFPFGFEICGRPVRNVLIVDARAKHIIDLWNEASDMANIPLGVGRDLNAVIAHVDCGMVANGFSKRAFSINRVTAHLPPGELADLYDGLPKRAMDDTDSEVLLKACRTALLYLQYMQVKEEEAR